MMYTVPVVKPYLLRLVTMESRFGKGFWFASDAVMLMN